MFGTIAHATLKPGQEGKLEAQLQDWKRDIRPKIPGPVVNLVGHRAGKLNEVVFIALTQDEATYRKLAEMPEQHQFYLRFNEVFTGEPTWEDVELEWDIRD
ncbi:MAG: hypothetical protein M3Q50_08510 [Chloroflexota bacterium]|nr:hypothetical protein [Chloroflexota bacterium]